MKTQGEQISRFYQKESALVSSPFITQFDTLNQPLLQSVFDQLGLSVPATAAVIDVGCGRGLMATAFRASNLYIGIDLVMQKTALGLKDSKHHFVQADGSVLPIKKASIDLLLCLDSFEHYPNMDRAAKEFHRVLRKDGVIFLSIPNYANVAGLVKWWSERKAGTPKNSWAPFHFWKQQELEQFITPSKVEDIFSRAGFIKMSFVGYREEVVVGLFPWIWHPKMPPKISSAIYYFFRIFSGVINKLFPSLSLHTFCLIGR